MSTKPRSKSSKSNGARIRKDGLVTEQRVKTLIKSAMANEAELKFYDEISSVTTTTINWSGITPYLFFYPAQGDGDSNRIGDSVMVKSVEYSFNLRFNGDGTGKDMNLVRILVFAWKPFYSDVAPVNTKLFLNTGGEPAPQGGYSVDGRDQYVIIGDHLVLLDIERNRQQLVRREVKMNHKVQWKAGNTTNCAGGLFYTIMSDADPAGSKPVLWSFYHRVKYYDA